jgi:predicted metal-dependent peptidase
MAELIEPEVIELLLQHKHFYGHLLQQFRRHSVSGKNCVDGAGKIVRTMAVMVSNELQPHLFINTDFYNSGDYDKANPSAHSWGLTQEEKIACLEHEILHILNKHLLRVEGRNHYVWNLANDIAINQYIKGLPSGLMCPDCNVFVRKTATGQFRKNCPLCNKDLDPKAHKFETLDYNNFRVGNNKITLDKEKASELYYDVLWAKVPKMVIEIGSSITGKQESAAKQQMGQGKSDQNGNGQQGQQQQGQQNQQGQGQSQGQSGQAGKQGQQSQQGGGQGGQQGQSGNQQGQGQGQGGDQQGQQQSGSGGGQGQQTGQGADGSQQGGGQDSGNGQNGKGQAKDQGSLGSQGQANEQSLGKGGSGHGEYEQKQDEGQGSGDGQGEQEQKESPQTGSGCNVRVNGIDIPMPMDNHEVWAAGSDNREMAHEKIKEMVKKAVHKASEKSQGNMPGWLKGLVDECLEHKTITWKSELRRFYGFREFAKFESTRKRLNRRFPVTFPGYKVKRKAHFVVATDSSGSVDDKEFAMFWKEIGAMFSAGVGITHVECDMDITHVQEYKKKPPKGQGIKRYGYGGTSFVPVFKFVEKKIYKNSNGEKFKLKGKIDGIIYLTDGAGDYPKKIPCPTIWVMTPEHYTNGWSPKLGKVIVMEND